jgi:hypothetical protein
MLPPLFINNNNLLNKKISKKKGKLTKKSKKQNLKKSKKQNLKKSKKQVKKRPEVCSPHLDTSKTNHSCFDTETLKRIVLAWNNTNPQRKIIIKKSDKHNDIWNKLGDKMSDKCGNEYCWTKQPFFKKQLKSNINTKKVFRPTRPKLWKKKPREWLDTNNILGVMEQYEMAYKDFKFFGPVPIDFDLKNKFQQCVVSELCSIDLEKLYNNDVRKIGVVFNLDKHDEDGSHWIAMYADMNKKIIGYWDSYGYTPPKEVTALMGELKKQASEKLNIECNIKINKVRHQYKNSECGVYSMNFIIQQLEGKEFKDVCNNIVKDDKMFSKRKKYFNYL